MSEFKVGDRVRIVNEDICGENRIGKICKKFLNYANMNRNLYEVDFGATYPYEIFEEDLELYEEKEEEIEENKKLITLDELLERIEKLEKCVIGEQNSLEKCENVSTMSKNGLLTEDERVILRNLNECWKWIVRDEDGFLSAWGNKPYGKKIGKLISWRNDIEILGLSLPFNDNILKFIKNKDEPYNIEELLKVECVE